LPRTGEGRRRQARRTGLESQEQAWEALDHLKALLDLAGGEGDVEVQIADLIQNALKARTPFPSAEEVRKRLGTGADVRKEAPTVGTYLKGWLAAKPDLAEGTRTSYQGHIRKYLVTHLGQVRLDRLKSTQVEAMFDAIEANNERILEARESGDAKVRASVRGQRVVSLSTKHRIRATLRSAL
jgi:hypothetical protein